MCCTQETEGNKLWYIANDFTSGMPSLRAIFKILFSGGMRVFVSVSTATDCAGYGTSRR